MPIDYTKTTWVNGSTPLNATNMNHIEDGIKAACDAIDPFIVNITIGEYSGYLAPVSIDKTCSEIYAAFMSGRRVLGYAVVQGMDCYVAPTAVGETYVLFNMVAFDSLIQKPVSLNIIVDETALESLMLAITLDTATFSYDSNTGILSITDPLA